MQNTLHTWTANGKWGAEFLNGDHSAATEYTLPSGKKTNFNFAMSNVNQARKFSTRLDLDAVALSGARFQTAFSTTINDFDRAQLTFNGVTDLNVKLTGMDDIKMRFEGKRAVRADKRNTDFKVQPEAFYIKSSNINCSCLFSLSSSLLNGDKTSIPPSTSK